MQTRTYVGFGLAALLIAFIGVSSYLTLSEPVRNLRQSDLYDSIVHLLYPNIFQPIKEANLPITPEGQPQKSLGRILVVEDNPVNQLLAFTLLRKLNYSVEKASNGREALDAISRTKFDLVLMDCQMPEMDGFEATREIRRLEKEGARVRLPIIALTANAMNEDRERCLFSGMDDHLAKPMKKEQLASIIDRWIGAKAKAA